MGSENHPPCTLLQGGGSTEGLGLKKLGYIEASASGL